MSAALSCTIDRFRLRPLRTAQQWEHIAALRVTTLREPRPASYPDIKGALHCPCHIYCNTLNPGAWTQTYRWRRAHAKKDFFLWHIKICSLQVDTPSFPFILALWALISLHFVSPPPQLPKMVRFPISHTKDLAAPGPAPFSNFWPFGPYFFSF